MLILRKLELIDKSTTHGLSELRLVVHDLGRSELRAFSLLIRQVQVLVAVRPFLDLGSHTELVT